MASRLANANSLRLDILFDRFDNAILKVSITVSDNGIWFFPIDYQMLVL